MMSEDFGYFESGSKNSGGVVHARRSRSGESETKQRSGNAVAISSFSSVCTTAGTNIAHGNKSDDRGGVGLDEYKRTLIEYDVALDSLESRRPVVAFVRGGLPPLLNQNVSYGGRDRSRPDKALTGQRTPKAYRTLLRN